MRGPLPTITVPCPVDRVFDYLADDSHLPGWAASYRVRKTIENQMVAFSATERSGASVDGTYSLEEMGASTRVTFDGELSPTGIRKLIKPVLEPGLRRAASNDLASLATTLSSN